MCSLRPIGVGEISEPARKSTPPSQHIRLKRRCVFPAARSLKRPHETGPWKSVCYPNHRCSHHTETNADGWPDDDVRLSDIEPNFTCTKYGRKGAEVRPAAFPYINAISSATAG
jgi:hypothetical protein